MIPKKDYISFTEEERKAHPIVKLCFKHEGRTPKGIPIGPLWVQFQETEFDTFFARNNPGSRNYQSSKTQIYGEEEYFAEWMKLGTAKIIAKGLGVELEEY